MTLKKWEDISKEFKHALILGNGASIALHADFKYKSLWRNAIGDGLISAELEPLAKRLKTGVNFELLLRQLWIAEIVDDHFKIDASEIKDAYTKLRNGLIETVRKIHCSHDTVIDDLRKARPFLKNFKTIFSLNYDLLVYWAIMANEETDDGHKFKDCFLSGFFDKNWERFRTPLQNETARTLVFYPHGALQFVQVKNGTDKKIDRAKSYKDLLSNVFSRWKTPSNRPLFVAEGDSSEKMRSIRRSSYLSTVYYEALPRSGPTLVIYGWSMNKKVDGHLLEQIRKGEYTKLAIAVHRPTTRNITDYITQIGLMLRGFGITDITYFDAESEGSWPQQQAGT